MSTTLNENSEPTESQEVSAEGSADDVPKKVSFSEFLEKLKISQYKKEIGEALLERFGVEMLLRLDRDEAKATFDSFGMKSGHRAKSLRCLVQEQEKANLAKEAKEKDEKKEKEQNIGPLVFEDTDGDICSYVLEEGKLIALTNGNREGVRWSVVLVLLSPNAWCSHLMPIIIICLPQPVERITYDGEGFMDQHGYTAPLDYNAVFEKFRRLAEIAGIPFRSRE
mmetsp:Transcript_36686/g.61901  ORF Transcript_36686/g.61901 Transcript_36686/m.61901 type:complete len:224 (-) Transcript_36686:186-857(-)|eukprot:jgi/Bigna1/86560/estExt_fgenesh1_pg.C_110217